MQQVTFRMPPKSVFDILCDPTVWEECTPWRVEAPEGRFEEGATWTERRRLRRREWTVVAYDRRGLSFTARTGDVDVTFLCKKGGTGSCNAQMRVRGPERSVARFEKEEGDRIVRLRDWLES